VTSGIDIFFAGAGGTETGFDCTTGCGMGGGLSSSGGVSGITILAFGGIGIYGASGT